MSTEVTRARGSVYLIDEHGYFVMEFISSPPPAESSVTDEGFTPESTDLEFLEVDELEDPEVLLAPTLGRVRLVEGDHPTRGSKGPSDGPLFEPEENIEIPLEEQEDENPDQPSIEEIVMEVSDVVSSLNDSGVTLSLNDITLSVSKEVGSDVQKTKVPFKNNEKRYRKRDKKKSRGWFVKSETLDVPTIKLYGKYDDGGTKKCESIDIDKNTTAQELLDAFNSKLNGKVIKIISSVHEPLIGDKPIYSWDGVENGSFVDLVMAPTTS